MFSLAGGRILPTAPGGRPVIWAATGRWGGVSAPPYASLNLASHVGDDAADVATNRGRVARLLGLPQDALAVMDAVHGADVAFAGEPGTYAGVDALVTQQAGLAVMALGADCVPLAIVGSDGVTVAAAHCGWRGLAADVVGAVVRAVRDRGTDVRAVILGPSVCGSCYPVPRERVDELADRSSSAVRAAALVRAADGQQGIDVREGLRARLSELGVAGEAVVLAGGCTVEDNRLFSYRRDGITGRHAVAVCTSAMMDS